MHTNPHIQNAIDTVVILHRYSNLPEVIQSIIDASSFLKRDYRTNNPYSFDAASSPHNPKQLCDVTYIYLDSTKTASTANTLQVHANGNKLTS